MDKTLTIVCAVVGSLGVLSTIFGFSAEGTKLTPYNIILGYDDDEECYYPPNPALGLGISAAVFLLAAQVTFTAVGGCCGCCNKSRSTNPSPSETKRIVGIVCAVFSWIAAVIAWGLLIHGAASNASGVRMDGPDCPCLEDGFFSGAGVLSLAATALGITSYVLMRTKRVKAAAPPAVVVPAEGEPKLPPPPAAAATQGNGSQLDEELQLPQPADTASGEPPAGAETGQQPPVQQPQVGESVTSGTMPPNTQTTNDNNNQPPQHQGYEQLILKELTKAGIKFAERVAEHTLLSDSNATPSTMPGVGDILDSISDQSTDENV